MPDTDPALALQIGGIGAWVWDIAADRVTGDQTFAALLGLDAAARPWPLRTVFAALDPADAATTKLAIEQACAGTDPFSTVCQVSAFAARWCQLRGQVTLRDAAGAPLTLTGVIWDISAAKTQEYRLALLASEMDHRVKNAFAVIRALISMAVRAAPANATFGASLKAQVTAMATAHNVSARLAREMADTQTPVPFADILDVVLDPWHAHQVIRADIPADVMLAPQEVAAVSMLVYELTANAAKYGALGERGGYLSITAISKAGGGRVLTWQEFCDAPPSEPSDEMRTRSGFGTVLVNHCASTLDATITRALTDTGLMLTLTLKPIPA